MIFSCTTCRITVTNRALVEMTDEDTQRIEITRTTEQGQLFYPRVVDLASGSYDRLSNLVSNRDN